MHIIYGNLNQCFSFPGLIFGKLLTKLLAMIRFFSFFKQFTSIFYITKALKIILASHTGDRMSDATVLEFVF